MHGSSVKLLFLVILPMAVGGMKVVQDYNERCSRRFVCNEAKGLVCLNRVCACATDYTYSNNSKTCLRVASHFVNSCEEDVQCYPSFDTYSKCLNGECTTRNDDANYKGQIPTYTSDSPNTGRNASISNFKVVGIILLFYFIFIQ